MNTTNPDYRAEVAAKIRWTAAGKDIKPHDIAEASGLSRHSVSRKCRGHSPITIEELIGIAFALDVNPGDLLPVTIPDAPKRQQDIASRAYRLSRDVEDIADGVLNRGVDGTDLGDWPKWAAGAHALRVAARHLGFIGKDVEA